MVNNFSLFHKLHAQHYKDVNIVELPVNNSGELTKPVVCILDAVLTVSPKKQYLGTFKPTTPATAGPE